jgi:hypothetical protein
MKISREQLIEMIKEEVAIVEISTGDEVMAAIADVPDAAAKIADKVWEEIVKLAEPSGLDPQVLAQAVSALLTSKE